MKRPIVLSLLPLAMAAVVLLGGGVAEGTRSSAGEAMPMVRQPFRWATISPPSRRVPTIVSP